MRRDDAPAFRQTNPDLTLSAAEDACGGIAFELQGDAAEVFAEGDDFEAAHAAGEIGSRAGLTEGFDFIDAIKIFTCAEADSVRRRPEHRGQGFDIVVDERGFIEWVELAEFCDRCGVVDLHGDSSKAGGEESALRQDALGDRGRYGDHGFVDELAEMEMHRDAAEQVGVDGIKAPAGDEQVYHAIGGVVCGGKGVGGGLDDDPCRGGGVWCGRRFYEWSREPLMLMKMEPEGDIDWAFDAVDANFSVALSGVGVAAGEERAGLLNG